MSLINDPPTGVPLQAEGARSIFPAWANFFMQVRRLIGTLTSSGTTAERPTDNLYVGRPYFDTSLGKPLWYDGNQWVDATGTNV